jgi:TMPIT-like protein
LLFDVFLLDADTDVAAPAREESRAMVIQGVDDPTLRDAGAADAAVAEAARAQDDVDRQGAELRRALDDLHARQDAFERNVKARGKALRALPSGHDGTRDLRQRLAAAARITPSSGGFFVELFLGSLNVRFVRKSERLAFKADYERLKQRLAPLFVVVCIFCLYFEENRWLHMLLQLALTTYYVALAIRENILLVNGSNIKAWWIVHHYLTMISGVLLLTWPNNAAYARFRNSLHLCMYTPREANFVARDASDGRRCRVLNACTSNSIELFPIAYCMCVDGLYNALLQIFQTRYQIARLYTLRSLGMAGEMDVSNSDSTQIHWSESMKLLLPLIVFGQIFQAGQALSLFRIYLSSHHELQILLLAILFMVLFLGNAITTSLVLFEKRKSVPEPNPRPGFSRPIGAAPPGASSSSVAGPPSTIRARVDGARRVLPDSPSVSTPETAA